MKKGICISLIIAAALAAIGCTPIKRGEYASGSATIFCDDGFKNILDEEIEVFEYSYPKSSIIPFYVSEVEALDTLLADKTTAIISSQVLTPEQVKFMKTKHRKLVRSQCIAIDAVALIVNKDNPIGALSTEEIGEILSGRVSKWNQLAVADTSAIRIVFDHPGSSTVSYMRERFLDGKPISDNPNAFAQKNNAQVFDIVKNDRNAIGIISVSWLGDNLQNAKKVPVEQRVEDYKDEQETIATVLTTEVKILKVSNPTTDNDLDPTAYEPYQVYINSGQYPLFRKIYMITTAGNNSVMNSFYSFMTGFVGQKIISHTGIMPYHVHARVVNLQ